eukprot:Gb_26934 [translate_table: standard]
MDCEEKENLCRPMSDGLRHLLRLWLDWHTSGSVAASLILQIILVICGIYRKRSSSKVVKALGWFSYMAADAVAIYTLGLMLGSACRAVYAVWAPLLLFHLGGPDNFTAYSDADTQLWLRHALTMVFQICVSCVIVFSSGREEYFIVGLLLIIAGAGKYAEKTLALRQSSISKIVSSMTPIYVFMQQEHKMSDDWDFNYLVCDEKIWFEKLKKINEGVANDLLYGDIEWYDTLKSSTDPQVVNDLLRGTAVSIRDVKECKQLKEIDADGELYFLCLAHSFSKLYMRRVSNLYCYETPHKKTRDLFMNSDYLPKQHIFRVIEMELSFIFDKLLTKAAATAYTALGILLRLIYLILLCIVAFYVFNRLTYGNETNSVRMARELTYMLVVAALCMDLFQLFRILISDWTRVWIACVYIKLTRNQSNNGYLYRLVVAACIRGLTKVNKVRWRYWKQRMGQHSVIDTCLELQLGPWKYFKKIHKMFLQEEDQLNVTEEIMYFVIEKLQNKCTSCTDIYRLRRELSLKEQTCLIENECEHLKWSIEGYSFEQALLHWHIATSLCEMSSDLQAATVHPDQLRSSACNVNPEVMKNNEEMSRILSRYCAYLLQCHAVLLPVNADFAKMVYKRACSEVDGVARSVFAKIKKNIGHSEKITKLFEGLLRQNEKEGAMGYGTKLGCQLLEMSEEKRWKVCADMWFELLAYCALENKAMLHVKTLAEGGEFITHLWTLLGHMAIGDYNKRSF